MKRKNKMKINKKGIKYLKYARYASFLLILAFMGLIASMMYISKISYDQLIRNNPILLAGFIDCAGNLLLFFLMKKDINNIENNEQSYVIQIKLMIDIAIFACLLNFPALIALVIGTMKCFNWDKNTLVQLKAVGKSKWSFILGYCVGFLCLILCFYWALASFAN